jgi:archaetidylinositol phosphate synthase
MGERMSKEDHNDPQQHTRVNDILLGPIERPVLAWFVKIMPQWVTPDFLTFTGLFASFLIAAAYMLCNVHKGFLWLASFGFILNWFGDSLDGSLARYRKIERPKYGFFIDHSVDTIAIIVIFIGLGISPFVTFEVACITLIGYLSMEILVLSATYVRGVFQISYSKLGPTEVRAIAIIVNTILFFMIEPKFRIFFGIYGLYDVVLVVVAFLMFYFFITGIIQNARLLADEERIKPRR